MAAVVTVWGRDGTIMSGDSLGMVTFWDTCMCMQLQSFHVHGADVLCLAIGPICTLLQCTPPPPLMFPQEGRSVYTLGVN